MLKELVKRSLTKLNLTSVYRIIFFSLLSIYLKNIYISLLLLILILFINKYEAPLYIVLIVIFILTNSIKVDYIPIGVVERKYSKYYVVDKILYKTNIYTDDLSVGDVIYTCDYKYNDDINLLKYNIKFSNTKYETINNISIKQNTYKRINNSNSDVKTILNKLFYNINDYDNQNFNIGYGLLIYYLIKYINKKNRVLGLISILFYSLIFYFDVKFYLLVIDILISKKEYRLPIKLFVIGMLNINLLKNYSILVPILFSIYSSINFRIGFKSYLLIMESLLFGYVNMFHIFIFKYIIIAEILELFISIISLYFNSFTAISIYIANIISYINSINFSIRGQISILCLLIFIIIKFIFKSSNIIFCFVLLCLLIISPLNNPFLHVSFIDVGQGDSILIKLPFNTCNVLIDTGSKYNYYKLRSYLYKQGIYTIDYLIITHDDSDHNGNIESLSNDFNVKKIIDKGEDIKYKDFILKYLFIDDFDNDNDNSLVYWTSINYLSFLFTGDISSNAEKLYVKKYNYLDIDVLKVSHHGSKTSSSPYFIGNVLPNYAIISTSGQYNHPAHETIETFDKYLIDYHITKTEGDIEFYLFPLFSILKNNNNEFVIIR